MKNVRVLDGLPLLAHSIAQAKEAGLFEAVAVSSDSEEILRLAARHGADEVVTRPAELATDTAPKCPAILHALRTVEERRNAQYDVLVDLDATSPLRTPSDIVGAVELLETTGVASVITGAPAHRSPYFNMVEQDARGFVKLSKPLPSAVVRRQDAPPCYDMNASIYVWSREAFVREPKVLFENTLIYVMPPERSHDIDSPLDFEIVELLWKRRAKDLQQ